MPNEAIRTDQPTDRAVRIFRLGTVEATTGPHYVPKIGPRIFLVFQENGMRYSLNLTPENARLLAMGLTAGACEAEARERKALHHAEQIKKSKPDNGDVFAHIERLLVVDKA